jgi:hypothetical protein
VPHQNATEAYRGRILDLDAGITRNISVGNVIGYRLNDRGEITGFSLGSHIQTIQLSGGSFPEMH